MTDKVSTAPEDVERLALAQERSYGAAGIVVARNLRALSAEVERLKVALFKSGAWMTAPEDVAQMAAELDLSGASSDFSATLRALSAGGVSNGANQK